MRSTTTISNTDPEAEVKLREQFQQMIDFFQTLDPKKVYGFAFAIAMVSDEVSSAPNKMKIDCTGGMAGSAMGILQAVDSLLDEVKQANLYDRACEETAGRTGKSFEDGSDVTRH